MPKALDITNMKFGELTAIRKVSNKGKKTYWLCQCSCGNTKEIQTCHLTSGKITSCGCKRNPLINDGVERKLICPICENEFITTNPSRLYCFDCRPEGLTSAEATRLKKQSVKHKLIVYKGGKCEKCGYDKCEGALQFHHRNPLEKEFNISEVNISSLISMRDLFNEVDKCDLLCANCHFEIHYSG